MRITPKLLDSTVAALTEALTFRHPADAVLSQFFREQKLLGSRDRGFVAETVYAVLRRKRFLEHALVDGVTPRRLVITALTRLQGLAPRQLAEALRPREVDWLAQIKAETTTPLTLAEQADFPDWLSERLRTRMSEAEVLQLARGLNQGAPLDLRVNPMKATREEVLAGLAADGIQALPGRYSPLAIRLEGKPALQRHPLYLSGAIEVQDEGSQLLAYLLAPKRGEMAVDFCAGAGGKTLALGAAMRNTGRLYAYDTSGHRLDAMKPRLARSGLSNVHPVQLTHERDERIKRMAGKIDRVLIDAPCSGLGTLRRNPDLKWRQSPKAVQELQAKQTAILESAARLLKPDGRLVYATCSLLRAENEDVADAFAQQHGADFEPLPVGALLAPALGGAAAGLDAQGRLRLWPHRHGTDGFFAAVWQRR